MYYQNVRGLRTKTKTLFSNATILNFDCFILTETWLCPSITNPELFDCTYCVYRKDRYSSNSLNGITPKGGGVLIAIKSNLNSSLVSIADCDQLEILCVKVKFSNKNVFIVCCYIPPNSNIDIYSQYNNAINGINEKICDTDEIMLFGDFNLPNLRWIKHDEESFMIPNSISNELECSFIDNINMNNFQQISNIPNFQGKQLDLIFTSDWNNLLNIDFPFSLVNIDLFHPPLSFSYCVNAPHYPLGENMYQFNFKKANYDAISEFLNSYDFSTIFNNIDIKDMINKFYEIIFSSFRQFIPMTRLRSLNSCPPWYTHELKKLRNKKNKSWRKYLKSKNGTDYNNFLVLFNEFKNLSEELYQLYVCNMSVKLKSNPKEFWKFVNMKRKCDEYPTFMNYNGNTSNDNAEISEYFRDFFSIPYSNPSFCADVNNFNHINNNSQISLDLQIASTQLIDYLEKLNMNYSPGPDGIPESILKKCSNALALPLSILFNTSLSVGIFPDIWKKAFIRPIFKKDSKNVVNNYRPIAKLSAVPKIFELVVFDSIYSKCSNIISGIQHGFVKHKSTTTNLVESTSIFLNNMESGFQTDVIYTDFSKAFDILPHSIILLKLEKYGFPRSFIKWIGSYLNGRTYSVVFRSSVSNPFTANSGVPQGSHLGPLLFILSVNDVGSFINHSNIKIYADDMKIFKKITSMGDATLLQSDLNNFFSWCTINNLLLNVSKCAQVTYSRRSINFNFTYSINNSNLSKTQSIRDLGVLFDSKLNFRAHYESIIHKANSMLGFVKRWSREFKDPYTLKSLYTSLVRPNLEYASQVWSPFYQIHENRIESIQKNFLRFALRNLRWNDPIILPPYENRLKLIQLSTLKLRREAADIVFLTEIIKGNIISPEILNKINFNTISHLRSSNLFITTHHRTNYGSNEPIHRMLSMGNKYKSYIDFTQKKDTLKHKIFNQH